MSDWEFFHGDSVINICVRSGIVHLQIMFCSSIKWLLCLTEWSQMHLSLELIWVLL